MTWEDFTFAFFSLDILNQAWPILLSGLVQDRLIEDVGDVERPDHGEGVDARLTALTENLGDDPLPFQVRRGVADHLDGDLVAGLGTLRPRVT